MKIWVSLPFLATSRLIQIVEAAEQLEIEGVAISEHVGVPTKIESDYPYTGTRAVLPIDTKFPDPIVLAASLGARVKRLRFMSHVLIVPLRHPILLAKEAATAAVLTEGRLDLGVGVGWMREEFEALGIPFHQRGSRMDETLPLLRDLWSGDPVQHQGLHFHFDAFALNPRPPAPIRILIGGYSEAALRRAALLGDGWVGINPTLEEIETILNRLRTARREVGTDRQPFEVRTGVRGKLRAETVQAMAKLGVDAVVVTPWQLVAKGAAVSTEGIVDALPELVATIQGAL
jgi:probable F420-dependent oxidoreductase